MRAADIENWRMELWESAESLVEAIYESAADTDRWPGTLLRIAEAMEGQSAILRGVSPSAGVLFDCWGGEKWEHSRLFRTLGADALWLRPSAPRSVNVSRTSDEIVLLPAMGCLGSCLEVQLRVAHPVSPHLGFPEIGRINFMVRRDRGGFDPHAVRLLEHLLPHIRRAGTLSAHLAMANRRACSPGDPCALEKLTCGVVLADCHGKVEFANAAIRTMEQQSGRVELVRGRIRLRLPSDQARLAAAILKACAVRACVSLQLAAPPADQPLSVLVTFVRGEDLPGYGVSEAGVLILFAEPSGEPAASVGHLIDAYRLTPSEAKIALAAATGGGASEIAEQLMLSRNTVKTHLRRVYSKLGVNRQAELTRLVLTAPSAPYSASTT